MVRKTSESCELSRQGVMIYLSCFLFLRVFHQITHSLSSDTRNYIDPADPQNKTTETTF